jgi:hypothetical protein
MPVVFFEGFNFSNGETVTLNPAYWAASAGFSFGDGRTSQGFVIPNRAQGTATTQNNTLQLANFTDPLSSSGGSNTCIGLGFWVNGRGLRSADNRFQDAPYIENLVSLTTNNGTLSVDCARSTDGASLLLLVRENGVTVDSYDFRSAVGNSWGINSNFGVISIIDNAMYLDLFFNAASGIFSVRAAGGSTLATPLYNSTTSATTAISSFSSITAITFSGLQAVPDWGLPNRHLDDFYFTAGNSVSDVFLGPNTRIYRLNVDSSLSNNWQASDGNSPAYQLSSNNGDFNYMKSAATGEISTLSMNNLPGDAPAYVNGVKIFNVVRKAGLDTQSLVNVMASTSEDTAQEIGPTYSIPSETYSLKESVFLTNPVTSSAWTTTAVNNMVLGVKNKT